MRSAKGHFSTFVGQFQTGSVWIFWENSAECAFKTCYCWGSHVLTPLLVEVSGTLVAWSIMSIDFRSTLGVPILPAFQVSCQLNWTKMTKPVKEWWDYKYLLLAAVIHYIPSDSWSWTIWHVHNMKVQLGRNWYVLQTILRSEDALNIE